MSCAISRGLVGRETLLPVGDVELGVVTAGSPSEPALLLIGTTVADWDDELVERFTAGSRCRLRLLSRRWIRGSGPRISGASLGGRRPLHDLGRRHDQPRAGHPLRHHPDHPSPHDPQCAPGHRQFAPSEPVTGPPDPWHAGSRSRLRGPRNRLVDRLRRGPDGLRALCQPPSRAASRVQVLDGQGQHPVGRGCSCQRRLTCRVGR